MRVTDQTFLSFLPHEPAIPFFLLRQNYHSGDGSGTWKHLDFYALYIVRGGRGLHVINNHPYAIARGDVYITPPGAAHAYQNYESLEVSALCFQIDLFSAPQLDALRALPGFGRLFVGEEWTARADGPHFHLAPQSLARAEEMLRELDAELPPGTEALPRADAVSLALVPLLVFRLLVWLAREREISLRRAPVVEARAATLADVLRFCETHFREDISVASLAAHLFVSPSHFGELFKRATGTSPAAYVRRLRLEHAQHLLRNSVLSLETIAQQSGLKSGGQFSRAFRAGFGQTPSEYRAHWGKKRSTVEIDRTL